MCAEESAADKFRNGYVFRRYRQIFSGLDGQGGLCQVYRIGDRREFFSLFCTGSGTSGSFVLVCRAGGRQGGKRKRRPALRLYRGEDRNPHAENREEITFHHSSTAVLCFGSALENAGWLLNRNAVKKRGKKAWNARILEKPH